MLAHIFSAGLYGIDGYRVHVEVELSRGLPGWHMVGLPETMVKESKDRVASAIRNSGYQIPNRKITINFAPAHYKKTGTAFDLPIAIGLLESGGVLPKDRAADYIVAGELSLDGRLKPIPGILSMAILARREKMRGIILPAANVPEAALVSELDIIPAHALADVVAFLHDGIRQPLPSLPSSPAAAMTDTNFSDIKGQAAAKRALEIAAAGGHNALLIGPPGAGKTMLAERLATILPPLSTDASLETTQIYSITGLLRDHTRLVTHPPFRAPHHSTSLIGLIGGGSGFPKPGEVSLAHNGILFLDEFLEFHRDAINGLREPLESGHVNLIRSQARLRYPARFLCVTAMNPCRCGFFGHPARSCTCSTPQIQKYQSKLSGPFTDRIDIQIEISALTSDELTHLPVGDSSETIRARVITARERQAARYGNPLVTNSRLNPRATRQHCPISPIATQLLKEMIDSFHLSARAYDRILRLSRTIADLEGAESIKENHIQEAIHYRALDRRQSELRLG